MNDRGKNAAERFLETAGRFPERPALEIGDGPALTYRQLAGQAFRAKENLQATSSDSPFVAVVADKSAGCYAAILGIMLAGKAYLPLNPRFPEQRNRFMLEKSGAQLLFDGGKPLPTGIRTILPDQRQDDRSAQYAYLLFTSGTTGEPKGVPVRHGNLSAYLDHMLEAYEFSPDDRFTQNFDLTFDLSVHDLFLCWSSGACLCVPEDSSSFGLAGFIQKKQPTVWFSVPSAAMLLQRMRLLKAGAFPSIRQSFFCGEPLLASTAAAWKIAAPAGRITNLYGPTEATIAISGYDLPQEETRWKQEAGILSLGTVFDMNRFTILETAGEDTGELCLSGPQVVEGYYRNAEADRAAFFEAGDPATRWYKTGDRVSVDDTGDLFYRGRSDAEVKISGFRVNLGEIEFVLSSVAGVSQPVVLYHQDGGQETLVAFIAVVPGASVEGRALDSRCRERLPWYMVPGKYIFVEEIPLNPNGKTDRKALADKYL